MKREEIKSVYDLGEYIDDSESYPSDVEDICNEHGWEVLDAEEICMDTLSGSVLYIGENGMTNIKRL